jgi:hypothetical protein
MTSTILQHLNAAENELYAALHGGQQIDADELRQLKESAYIILGKCLELDGTLLKGVL